VSFGERNASGSDRMTSAPEALRDPALYDGVPLRRVIAYAVDVLILAVIGLAIGIVLWILTFITFGLLGPIAAIVGTLLPFAYHTYFIGRNGATPGMAWLGLEVRTWTGGPPDFVRAGIMTAVFYVTVFPTAGLILLVVLLDDRNRTLHDMLSGCQVVRTAPN